MIEIGAGWFVLIILASLCGGAGGMIALAMAVGKRQRHRRERAVSVRYPEGARDE